MAFNINEFRANGLTKGGARPSLFQVELTPPSGIGVLTGSARKFTFTCRGATLPPSIIGTVEAGYFGRRAKMAGDRIFPDWTVSIYNDEDFLVRDMFEKWSNAMNMMHNNRRSGSVASLPSAAAVSTSETSYMADLAVHQFAKDDSVPIRSYSIIGAFPTQIDPIELNWDNQNQIEMFNVTFSYQYWDLISPSTPLDPNNYS